MYTHALNDFLWLVYCANMSLPEETNYNNIEHRALGIIYAKKFLKLYLFPNKLLSFTYGSSDIENRAFIEFSIRTMDANAVQLEFSIQYTSRNNNIIAHSMSLSLETRNGKLGGARCFRKFID